jgi:hypothetical protein
MYIFILRLPERSEPLERSVWIGWASSEWLRFPSSTYCPCCYRGGRHPRNDGHSGRYRRRRNRSSRGFLHRGGRDPWNAGCGWSSCCRASEPGRFALQLDQFIVRPRGVGFGSYCRFYVDRKVTRHVRLVHMSKQHRWIKLSDIWQRELRRCRSELD